MRKAYLSEAKKALEPYRKDFEIANPGQTLDIPEQSDKFEIEVVKDETYSKMGRITALALNNISETRGALT